MSNATLVRNQYYIKYTGLKSMAGVSGYEHFDSQISWGRRSVQGILHCIMHLMLCGSLIPEQGFRAAVNSRCLGMHRLLRDQVFAAVQLYKPASGLFTSRDVRGMPAVRNQGILSGYCWSRPDTYTSAGVC